MSLIRIPRAPASCVIAAFLLALAIAPATAASPQATNATLSGTIVDATGGVLPGVAVMCRNIRTGLTWEAATNEVGIFRFAELPIGHYELTSALMGFQKLVRGEIVLLTGQVLDLKLTMSTGGLETVVNVTEAVPVTQTSSSSVQTSMTVRQVQELPLNGRNALQLVVLTAGATITDAGTVVGQQDNRGVSVNGLRATQNNWRLDGSNYNNRFFGSAPVLPNPDTLEEFTVQSGNYSARTAGAGALVELSTRSGTNQFRASAFEYFRDTALNANEFFNNMAGRPKPPFKLNQFGGTAGGPVMRNKTFYFAAYQGTRGRSAPGAANTIRSLTVDERDGNFSKTSTKVIDPVTGIQFPGNIIPVDRLDPMVRRILDDLLPLPNSGTNLVFQSQQDVDDDQVMGRVDHQLSSRNRFTVRYFYDANRFQRPFNAPPGFWAANDFRNQSLVVRDSHTFNSNLMMTLQGSFSRFRRVQEPIAPGLKTLQDYGVKAPQSVQTDFFPGVRFIANPSFQLFSGGGLDQTPSGSDVRATVIYSRGRHNLQFGADLEFDRLYVLDASFTVGSWTFSGARTGFLLADVVMGLPSRFVQDSGRSLKLAESKYHFWLQDDWKLTRRLTLNLGLRWEPWTPPTDAFHNLVGFVEGQQSTVSPDAPLGMVYPGDAGIPPALFSNDYTAFAPRVGAAFDLFGSARTILRGGYGIYYSEPPLTLYTRTVSTQPSVLTVDISSPPSFQDPFSGIAGGSPFPFPRVEPSQFSTFKYVKPVSGGLLDPVAKKGYFQNWNVTVEQQLAKDFVLSFAYVGNRGRRILGAMEMNPAVYRQGATIANTDSRRIYPGIGAMEIATPYERSAYDSFQFVATKRTSHGLSVLATYVYGKNFDNNSSTVEGAGSYPRSSWNPDIDWGPSDFDVRHRANVSFIYDVPEMASLPRVLGAILSEWTLNGIVAARSGLPFTVRSGTDRSLSGIGRDHGDLIGDPTRPEGVDPVWAWFNTAAFTAAAAGTFGSAGRNDMRGPGAATVDLALVRTFPVGAGLRMQFRAEAFNLLNRANFNNPNSSVNAGNNFGRILGTSDPRVIQFGLKIFY